MKKMKFTNHTRMTLGIPCAIIVLALILQLCGVGLNLGIDFTGGSILEYSVGEDYDIADVETILASVGYSDAQVTKAAPSAASEALQAELQTETTEDETTDVTDETADTAEETTEEVTEETSTEETTEETTEEASSASLLNADKSGIEADGLTDLQIRLTLVDETEGMDTCVTEAVQSVVSGASLLNYTQLTYQTVSENGYDSTYTGGYMLEMNVGETFDADAVEAAVTAALSDGGYSVNSLSVSAYTPEDGAEESAVRIMIDLDDVTSQVRAVLEKEMSAKYPNFHFVSIDHVSAIAGRDLLSNAVKALLLAFVCMLIYIAIRFDTLSGLAALFALLHDVLIMFCFMVFFRGLYQVNSSFIAAILTIVGYSINNTIIIFDRIRENVKLVGTSKTKTEIVEMSVSSTLSRTANTTITTLITLVCLYIFGVESIREFAFPLIVGMLAGTYSSVMLSGQVWAIWSDKLAARKEAKKTAKKA